MNDSTSDMHRQVIALLWLGALVAVGSQAQEPRVLSLSSELVASRPGVLLEEHWRFRAQDGTGWDDPDLDDGSWDTVDNPSSLGRLPGIVWLRLHLDVDEALWERPMGLQLNLRGAAELYLDGQLLYRFGSVDPLPKGVKADSGSRLRTFSFLRKERQVLAIRYNNNPMQGFDWISGQSGFELIVGDLAKMITRTNTIQRSGARLQMFFVSAFVCATVLHLLLFVFYPQQRSNLYFAVSTAGFAFLVGFLYERLLSDDQALLRWAFRLWGPALFLTWVALVRFAYSLYHRQLPKRFWLFLVVGVGLGAVAWLRPQLDAFTELWWFQLLTLAEVLRVSVRAIRKGVRGAWILSCGLGCFAVAITYQLLIARQILEQPWENAPVAWYGIACLLVATSVYLAREFAHTHRNLEEQLVQVKELSAKTLEQELQAKDQELNRRLLEADNRRKTEELEEARRFQLSLLPTSLPSLPHLKLAVSMQTATEVGGDYYDFHLADDGTLTVALGDATGHGAKAGTMVSVMKGLFSAFADQPDIHLFFHESSKAIRRMDLGGMQMALAVAKFEDHTLTYAAAGMPPILHYKSREGKVEEVLVEGMPLGGIREFPYHQTRVSLQVGDTVLMMSDGFPELLSPQQEILDYDRARASFEEVADRAPEEIIAHLTATSKGWSGGGPPGDDVTFVVLKVG